MGTAPFTLSEKLPQSALHQLADKRNIYLADIDREAEKMFERLTRQMAIAEGVTEQLKADNQMAWVGRMNNIRYTY